MTDYAKLKKTVVANAADNKKAIAAGRKMIAEGAKKADALARFFARSAERTDLLATKLQKKLAAWTRVADDILARQAELEAARAAGDADEVRKLETSIAALDRLAESHRRIAQVTFDQLRSLTVTVEDRMGELDRVAA